MPSIASWTLPLVKSAQPPVHHPYLQSYTTNLPLYLSCLHQLLKLYLRCSTLTMIIAPQMKYILSQLGQSLLITRPSGIRKHSKNQFKIWQIILSFPHSTLYNLVLLLTKHGTDCRSCSSSWMILLQFKSSISLLPTLTWYSLYPTPLSMPTIHPWSGMDSLVLRMWKHRGNEYQCK